MTVQIDHSSEDVQGRGVGPVAAPRRLRQRRFRVAHAMLAAGVIALGALGGGVALAAVAADGEYLAITRDVAYGAQLSASDLQVVRVDAAPGLDPVPATELDRVVGTYAAMPLVGGTLLTARMLTGDPTPGPGEYVVGITLRGDRLPAQRPEPGDAVLLVATTDPGVEDTGLSGRTWPATVTAVAAPNGGLFVPGSAEQGVTLDVVVPVRDGPDVARAAAAGELTVILSAGG
jgi:hypothetical protein